MLARMLDEAYFSNLLACGDKEKLVAWQRRVKKKMNLPSALAIAKPYLARVSQVARDL